MTQLAFVPDETNLQVLQRTVVLPFTPPSKNVYEGWQPQWKRSLRHKWARHLLVAFDEQQFPTHARKVAVHARLVFGSAARRDWQNYVHPMMNVVADELVRYGAIPDDTPQFFTCGSNGGIEFDVDRRKFVDAKDKRRTHLGFAFEL